MNFIIITLVLFAADQASKLIAQKFLTEGVPVAVIPGLFQMTLVKNTGAAFGLFAGRTWVFIVITAILLISVAVFWRTIKKLPVKYQIGLSLLTGGALGNLTDRLNGGYVVDFFDFIIWPVFNVADIGIVTGVGILIYSILSSNGENNERLSTQ